MKPLQNGKRYLIQSGESRATIAIYIDGVFVLESDYFDRRDDDPDWKERAVEWPQLRWTEVPRVPGRAG